MSNEQKKMLRDLDCLAENYRKSIEETLLLGKLLITDIFKAGYKQAIRDGRNECNEWKNRYESSYSLATKHLTELQLECDKLREEGIVTVRALSWIINNASSYGLEAEPYVERAKKALNQITKEKG